jgi:hypothetical protein
LNLFISGLQGRERERKKKIVYGDDHPLVFYFSNVVVFLRPSCIFIYLERFHELDKRCREMESVNNELKQLNTQLEKDLLSVGGVAELFRPRPEVY